jgi:hypothetical protein
MCVYRKLQQQMLSVKVSPNILYELMIPEDEQLSGQLSRETLTDIENKLMFGDEDRGIHSSMENFLSVQTVSDKTIADGVEALIGAYLKVRCQTSFKVYYVFISCLTEICEVLPCICLDGLIMVSCARCTVTYKQIFLT